MAILTLVRSSKATGRSQMATPTVELLKRAFSNSRDSPMVPRGTQSPTRLTAIPDALGAMIIPTPGLRSSLLKCTQVQQLYLHHTAPYCYVNTYASHYRRFAERWHKRGAHGGAVRARATPV